MAPIYDSDLAEERWSKDEWRSYELWEQVEHRLKIRKRIWIVGAVVMFMVISSIPLVLDQTPRWRALSASRHLAQELDHLKSEASILGKAFRIRTDGEGFGMTVETSERCASPNWVAQRSLHFSKDDSLRIIAADEGVKLGIPSLVSEFCYDPYSGSAIQAGHTVGFAIAPVKDLTIGRTDRIGVLTLAGISAETHFE